MANKLKSRGIRILSITAFFATACFIIFLTVQDKDFWEPKKKEPRQSRLIIPKTFEDGASLISEDSYYALKSAGLKQAAVDLTEGEIQVASLSEDLNGDGVEDQVLVYRNLQENDNPIYITFIAYDSAKRDYKRLWSAATEITRPGTVSIWAVDLTGDREPSIVITGMNQKNQQTLSAFKITHSSGENGSEEANYRKIIGLTIDGSISVQETDRSQAYQMGFVNGESFNILERGRDLNSSNSLDQIENIYAYNPLRGVYQKASSVKIPGSQIEVKRIRDILSGGKEAFEDFIDGLWYHVDEEGTVDSERYIYFDTSSREVSFYTDDTQQVYSWKSSYTTRYGLFISSVNISVSTFNRKIDIELSSIDNIRVRVSEDVRMRILMSAPWDGLYRKVKSLKKTDQGSISALAFLEGEYNSPIGRIYFNQNGDYKINNSAADSFTSSSSSALGLGASTEDASKEAAVTGKYSLYKIGAEEFIEFVPAQDPKNTRQTYRIERNKEELLKKMTLHRVRFGVFGLHEFRDPPIALEARASSGA